MILNVLCGNTIHDPTLKVGLFIKPWHTQQAGIHQFTKQLAIALARSKACEYYLVGSSEVDVDLPRMDIPAYAERNFDPRRWLMGAEAKGLDWIIDPTHFGSYGLFGGVKRCAIVHDLTAIMFPQYHGYARVAAHRLFFKRALQKSEAIVTISKQTEKDLRNYLVDDATPPVHQFYPGFQPPAQTTESVELPHDRFFLSVGTSEPRKNLQGVIGSFERVAATVEDAILVIAGPKGWKEAVNKRVENSAFRDRIVHLGFVSPEQLQWLYRHAIALIYPSFYEGFGFPVLEAMAAECPVITSNLGSMKEIASDAALLVDPRDWEALAATMERVASSDVLRRELTSKGLVRSEAFQWRQFVHQLEQHCFEVESM